MSKFKETSFYIFSAGALAFYLVFIFSLIIATIMYIRPGPFLKALRSPEVLFSIKLSLFTATITTILSLFLAIPAAYALSKYHYPAKTLFDTILDLPVVLPPISVGVILLVFFMTPLGEAIQKLGIKFVFAVPGIVLAQFTVVCGFALRILKSTFDSINPRYENVARTLGFSRWQAFWKITVPLAKNGLIAAAVLTWARAMGEFGATVIFAGAWRMRTEVMPIAIYLQLARCEIEGALAVALILIFISLGALLVFRQIGARPEVR